MYVEPSSPSHNPHIHGLVVKMRISENTYIFSVVIALLLIILGISINDFQPLVIPKESETAIILAMIGIAIIAFATGAVETK